MRKVFPLITLATLALSACSTSTQAPVAVKGQVSGEPAAKLTTTFNPAESLKGQIVYGTVSSRGGRPYQAYLSIKTSRGSFMCGGSIISNQWILTAAHCMEGASASGITVRVGVNRLSSSEGESITASSIAVHPNYSSTTNANDIALIKLSRAMTFDTYKQAIKLPNSTVESVLDVAGKYAVVSGWGKTETGSTSDVLREVSIPITPNPTKCGNGYPPANTICGEYYSGKDSCNGDSGGPLANVYNGSNYVLGIVSYGPAECRGYGIYTRVNAFLPWIQQVSGVAADGSTTDPTDPPPPAPGSTTYNGNFVQGQYDYAPSSSGFFYSGGTIKGVMTGPVGTDFDLYLEKKGSYSWSTVAKSEGSTANESISYSATAGTYRWKVVSYKGSGDVTLVETK